MGKTLPAARQAVAADENQHWLRHGGTWFAGVNVLANDGQGRVKNGIALQGLVAAFLELKLGANLSALDRAQISVCYPGYPKASEDQSSTSFAYRLRRDAAHLDGLLRDPTFGDNPPERYIRENHDYILGIALSEANCVAAPFVVWRGSHQKVHQHFSQYLQDIPPQKWVDVPIRETYQALRKKCFDNCDRIELPLQRGQAVVAHRLLLHGTAPWDNKASADSDGRMLCFFRPASLSPQDWLAL